MLLGVGSGISFDGREIANIHSMQIAQSIIYGGYALVIAGVIKEGFSSVLASINGEFETRDDHSKEVADPVAKPIKKPPFIGLGPVFDKSSSQHESAKKLSDEELAKLSQNADNAADADSIEQWRKNNTRKK